MKRGDNSARSAIRNSASNYRGLASASLAIALEPRFMYDAAGAATAAAVATGAESQPVPEHKTSDAAEQSNTSNSESHQSETTVADVGPYGSKAEAHLDAAAHADTAAPITEIIFVDARLPDIGALAARPGVEVVVLDPSKDGISQVSDALAGRQGITAVHFVGHGDSGEFALGSTRVDAATLSQRAGDISGWSAALGQNADLMIWGCDVGAQAAG